MKNTTDSKDNILLDDLYNSYTSFCTNLNVKPQNKNHFAAATLKCYPESKIRKTVKGKKLTFYKNISVKTVLHTDSSDITVESFPVPDGYICTTRNAELKSLTLVKYTSVVINKT